MSLSGTGLGTSALYNCIPPTPKKGKMAMDRTIIPIPPNHWMKLRHSSIPRLNPSMSVRIDEPVVVNPETDSKNASTKVKDESE